MRPRPLNRRADLIRLLRDRVPSRACGRAIDEGRVFVLGGFKPLQGFPYYAVKVDSHFGKRWYLTLECDDEHHRLIGRTIDSIDWSAWDGNPKGEPSLRNGDNPKLCAAWRAEATAR